MTNDTMKSLGYLKKSLKMTKRALEKNKAEDCADADDFAEINYQIDGLMKQINAFEGVNSVPAATPSPTAVNPTPPPSTSSTTDDGSDDLLTT
jgi:hypothetical protein